MHVCTLHTTLFTLKKRQDTEVLPRFFKICIFVSVGTRLIPGLDEQMKENMKTERILNPSFRSSRSFPKNRQITSISTGIQYTKLTITPPCRLSTPLFKGHPPRLPTVLQGNLRRNSVIIARKIAIKCSLKNCRQRSPPWQFLTKKL